MGILATIMLGIPMVLLLSLGTQVSVRGSFRRSRQCRRRSLWPGFYGRQSTGHCIVRRIFDDVLPLFPSDRCRPIVEHLSVGRRCICIGIDRTVAKSGTVCRGLRRGRCDHAHAHAGGLWTPEHGSWPCLASRSLLPSCPGHYPFRNRRRVLITQLGAIASRRHASLLSASCSTIGSIIPHRSIGCLGWEVVRLGTSIEIYPHVVPLEVLVELGMLGFSVYFDGIGSSRNFEF